MLFPHTLLALLFKLHAINQQLITDQDSSLSLIAETHHLRYKIFPTLMNYFRPLFTNIIGSIFQIDCLCDFLEIILILAFDKLNYYRSDFTDRSLTDPMSNIDFKTFFRSSCFLMFAVLTKAVFCRQFLLLERPPFSYMNGDPLFFISFFSQIICICITYLSHTKISSTEVTLIFAIVSKFSDFPLNPMQKCIKTVRLLLDRPPFVPSAGDIVFLLLFSEVKSLIDTLL